MVQVVYRSGTVLFLMLIFINAIPVPAVFADAPGTRGEEAQPIGGTQPSEPETGGSGEEVPLSTAQGRAGADARIWQGVQILPPPGGAAEQARLAPAFPAVQQTGTSSLLPWLSRELNPGNWILDAGLGIFTAITASVSEMFQQSVMTLMGSGNNRTMVAQAGQWSIIPASCGDGALYNMIFCTPPALTYAHAGIQNVWGVLRAIATGLVTLLFLIRIGRMLGDGSRALTVEARPLIVTFLMVILFVQSTEWVCQFLVDFFNAISTSILANASLTFPAQGDTPFNIGASIMALFFWLLGRCAS